MDDPHDSKTMADRNAPLVIQSDFTLLLEVDHPRYAEARGELVRFAELVKAPEHVHTYRITPLSVWNAAAAGVTADAILSALARLSRFELPPAVVRGVRDIATRFGVFRLVKRDGLLVLEATDPDVAALALRDDAVGPLLGPPAAPDAYVVELANRGRLKQALVKLGYPAEDLAGFDSGEPLAVELRDTALSGASFRLRPYQQDAVAAFHRAGTARGGAGVVVLPCGAGKTVVGMGCLAATGMSTLVLCTGVTAVHQWRAELLDKTTLSEDQIGEYTGQIKGIRPVTLTTYQMLTWRKRKGGWFPHLEIFDRRNWGLIIYDEVHLLPAPIFQVTAGLQARRRLGLTATLVREDGREDEVFALIGPRKTDVPWKELERQGWIASARCTEVRLPLPPSTRQDYFAAGPRSRFRVAAENPLKADVVTDILRRHPDVPALIIGMYVDQVRAVARSLGVPFLTGTTSQRKRDHLFAEFRRGTVPTLAVSKIANFAVDLPSAGVAVQISGTFGSRQEEAQRLGRLLRPKAGENQAHFYSLVSVDTVEQDFALNRQLFLCEQGYEYAIEDWTDGEVTRAPS